MNSELYISVIHFQSTSQLPFPFIAGSFMLCEFGCILGCLSILLVFWDVMPCRVNASLVLTSWRNMEHSFFLCLITLESEHTRLIWNVRNYPPSDTAPYPSRPESSSWFSLSIVLMGEIFGTDKFLLYEDSVCGQVLLYLSLVFCTLHIIDVSKF